MKILVLDNYDSFTYNLVQYIERVLKSPVDVKRNDQIELEEVDAYDKILISPGPGIPVEAGLCLDLIKAFGPVKSIALLGASSLFLPADQFKPAT